MAQPKTLLALAGAFLQPAAWSESTLLLIDHQREYREGGLPLPAIRSAVDALGGLLGHARGHGVPVVHVVHHSRPGAALFDPEGPFAAILPGLGPLGEEPVVIKGLPNAFAATDLGDRLRAIGRRSLIVAGFQTHMCVSSTVRAALDQGFSSTVVASGCASRDLPDPLAPSPGGVLSAADVHRAALAELADRFAVVVADADGLRP
jgi:nicotinamidase-related amidase